MAVKRERLQSVPDNQEYREFERGAERRELPAPELPLWELLNQEPKVTGTNFRLTRRQADLLRVASSFERVSQQKVLESIVWPVLEERYGQML